MNKDYVIDLQQKALKLQKENEQYKEMVFQLQNASMDLTKQLENTEKLNNKKTFISFCSTKSHVQQYECQVIKNNIAFDGCLWQELSYLWQKGIKTIGSCCGCHLDGRNMPCYIQVIAEHEDKMTDLGYQKVINEHDVVIFKPKTQIMELP